jgi:hypothetical protein
MIANCDSLLTRYSSVVLVAAVLGKKVYSDIPEEQLKRLAPVQNNGTSAERIAKLGRYLIEEHAKNEKEIHEEFELKQTLLEQF